jgi:hypothetical protein
VPAGAGPPTVAKNGTPPSSRAELELAAGDVTADGTGPTGTTASEEDDAPLDAAFAGVVCDVQVIPSHHRSSEASSGSAYQPPAGVTAPSDTIPPVDFSGDRRSSGVRQNLHLNLVANSRTDSRRGRRLTRRRGFPRGVTTDVRDRGGPLGVDVVCGDDGSNLGLRDVLCPVCSIPPTNLSGHLRVRVPGCGRGNVWV